MPAGAFAGAGPVAVAGPPAATILRIVNVGANAQVDSKTAQQAIIGYVLTNGGLMANVSLEGTKITPLSI